MIISTWLNESATRLLTSGTVEDSAAARFESELLLSKSLGKARSYLRAHTDEPLLGPPLHLATRWREQRCMGEPIAYLLGEQDFYQHRFAVNSATLIPRADTELLVETALSLPLSTDNPRVLDLATGSGIIGLSLKLARPNWQLTLSDLSASALSIAQHNAQQLDAAVEIIQSHWFCKIAPPFSLIVSNPPYVEAAHPLMQQGDVRFEPKSALLSGEYGLDDIKIIVQDAPALLETNGWLALEHGYTQGSAVRDIFVKHGFSNIETRQDLGNNDRVTLGQKKLN